MPCKLKKRRILLRLAATTATAADDVDVAFFATTFSLWLIKAKKNPIFDAIAIARRPSSK